ncbi:MAG: hypothetical protein H6835_05405 [Planctomycetes bacterium]|nr:hypothetical protein [Planctomycetota bacterium]
MKQSIAAITDACVLMITAPDQGQAALEVPLHHTKAQTPGDALIVGFATDHGGTALEITFGDQRSTAPMAVSGKGRG